MLEVKVKNDVGEMLNLSTSTDYTLYKVTGLNPMKMNINSSSSSNRDGGTINSIKGNLRNLVLYVTINGDVEANRIKLYQHFPLKKELTIYCKTGNRDVYIEGYVELIEVDLFTSRQVAQISVICAEPYFKSVNEFVTYFSQIDPFFSFPFSISEVGMELATVGGEIRKNILNAGEVETGMIIEIYAVSEVVNPAIYDVFKRTHIKLNLTMQPNDTIVINTNSGKKSITLLRAGIESNIMGYLAPTSTWMQLTSGDNVITYDADSGESNMQLTFSTLALYGGV